MLILSRVCAEFVNKAGQTIFSVTPQNLFSFLEAPEEIREDPLFDMMLRDGSLEAVRSVAQRRELESDPAAGIAPDGRKRKPAAAAEAVGPDPLPAVPEAAAPTAAGASPSAASAAEAVPAAEPAPADASAAGSGQEPVPAAGSSASPAPAARAGRKSAK